MTICPDTSHFIFVSSDMIPPQHCVIYHTIVILTFQPCLLL